jgi:hypothetical protein
MKLIQVTTTVILVSHLWGAYDVAAGVSEFGFVPNTNQRWRSHLPGDQSTATESFGKYTGTFRGDPNWLVTVDTYIDPDYAPNQNEILRQSLNYVMQNFFSGLIWNCADRNGPNNTPLPSVGDFQNYLYQNTRVENGSIRLYITRFWFDDTGVFGVAHLGDRDQGRNLSMDRTYLERYGHFWITLNSQKMGWGVPGSTGDLKAWAGMIAHEMLHNAGLIHPTFDSTGRRIDYIYAFGDCMEREP